MGFRPCVACGSVALMEAVGSGGLGRWSATVYRFNSVMISLFERLFRAQHKAALPGGFVLIEI